MIYIYICIYMYYNIYIVYYSVYIYIWLGMARGPWPFGPFFVHVGFACVLEDLCGLCTNVHVTSGKHLMIVMLRYVAAGVGWSGVG